jgi:hypothetical protein
MSVKRSAAIPTQTGTSSWRYRLSVGSRVLAAIAGGYAFASGLTVALALGFRHLPKEEVINLATLPSFLVWAGAVVWVFSARTAWRAWAGVAAPCVLVALAIWGLRSGGVTS